MDTLVTPRQTMSESTADRLDLIDARMRAQTEATDKVQCSIADLRTSVASDVQRSIQDLLVTQRDDKSAKSELSEIKSMLTLVLNSNKAIAKRLDTLEASVKAQQASETSLEARVLALKTKPHASTANTSSVVSCASSPPTAPKSASVQSGVTTLRSLAASAPVPHPATTPTATAFNSKAFDSLFNPPDPSNPVNHHSPTLSQTQWLSYLKHQVKVANRNRLAAPLPDELDLATLFVRWYFPRHGCSHPVFEQTKIVLSGKGTLNERSAWKVKMALGGEAVWRETGISAVVEQRMATVDLSRALIEMDPDAWVQFRRGPGKSGYTL